MKCLSHIPDQNQHHAHWGSAKHTNYIKKTLQNRLLNREFIMWQIWRQISFRPWLIHNSQWLQLHGRANNLRLKINTQPQQLLGPKQALQDTKQQSQPHQTHHASWTWNKNTSLSHAIHSCKSFAYLLFHYFHYQLLFPTIQSSKVQVYRTDFYMDST